MRRWRRWKGCRRARCRLPRSASSAISLMQALPASVHYAREGAPVFRAFDDMAATAHGGDRVDTIGLHASARRAAEWATPILPARVAKAPHGYEWLTLVALWKGEPDGARLVRRRSGPHRSRAVRSARARSRRAPTAGDSSSPPSSAARGPTTSIGTACSRRTGCSIAAGRVTAEVAGVTARDKAGPAAGARDRVAASGSRRTTTDRAGRPASRRRRRAGHRRR